LNNKESIFEESYFDLFDFFHLFDEGSPDCPHDRVYTNLDTGYSRCMECGKVLRKGN
jgi:hypothetical protein